MNTTYTANENCFLIDGEVYLTSNEQIKEGQYFLNTASKDIDKASKRGYVAGGIQPPCYKAITHSTKPLDGVTLLPRDKFVKPKDVGQDAYDSYMESGIREHNSSYPYIEGFKAGHNANPNSFTGEQLDEAAKLAFRHGQSNMMNEWQSFNEIRKHFAPKLSLPASLEINEQGEIVNVIW